MDKKEESKAVGFILGFVFPLLVLIFAESVVENAVIGKIILSGISLLLILFLIIFKRKYILISFLSLIGIVTVLYFYMNATCKFP